MLRIEISHLDGIQAMIDPTSDGRDGPFADELGWRTAQPPLTNKAYRSSYEALQRSDSAQSRYGRRFWTDCMNEFSKIRPRKVKDALGKFIQHSESHSATCLELLVAKLFPKIGIVLSEPMENDPDFACQLENLHFIAECKAVVSMDDDHDPAARNTEVISESIRSMRLGGLQLNVTINGKCKSTPKKIEICDPILKWVETNPTLKQRSMLKDSQFKNVDPLCFDVCGAAVQIKPIYFNSSREATALGVISGNCFMVDGIAKKLRESIKVKADKYKEGPVFLVIGTTSKFSDIHLMLDAIYGPLTYTFNLDPQSNAIAPRSDAVSRGIDGALFHHEPLKRQVVAVMCVSGQLTFPWLSKIMLVPNQFTKYEEHYRAINRLMATIFGDGSQTDWLEKQINESFPIRQILDIPSWVD